MKYSFLRPKYQTNLIRLGSKNDGGYLVPEEVLYKTKILLSFGLNDDWSFEEDFKLKNKEVFIYSYDHTVDRKFWYKYTIISFFYFLKNFKNFSNIFKYLKYKNFFKLKFNNFHIKKKIVNKEYGFNEISINKIAKKFKKDVFLKIDIENDEYRILDEIKNFKQLLGFVIEFHYVDLNYKIIKDFLSKNSNFKIVHIHPNNMGGLDTEGFPTTLEISFINTKLCKKYKLVNNKKFKPHLLDSNNDPSKKKLKMKF